MYLDCFFQRHEVSLCLHTAMPVGLCPTVFSQDQLDWITATHEFILTCVKICFHIQSC